MFEGLHYEDLKAFTNGFSEDNLIGKFQFGKVYRGIWKEFWGYCSESCCDVEVVVKIYEDPLIYKVCPGDTQERIGQEMNFISHFYRGSDPNPFSNMTKFVGVWSEGERGACVYQISPLGPLNILIPKDCFNWLQRIKVGFGFACTLQLLHSHNPPYLPHLIRNIDAAHIIVDKDYNPILYDFSMISGGIFIDRKDILNQYVHGCYGYVDPSLAQGSGWSEKCDVFSYGVVLLGLIMKRVYTDEDREINAPFVYELAINEYNSENKSSLVHQSLEDTPCFHSSDGIKITKLALRCVDYNPQKRPTMKEVVECFQQLYIASHHADALGINQTVGSDDSHTQRDFLSGFFPDPVHNVLVFNKGRRSQAITETGKERRMMRICSFEDLSFYTNRFNEENFIGKVHHGKMYLGEVEGQRVTVKIWEQSVSNEVRLREELDLLRHPKFVSHPNFVNLIGYCLEEHCLGMIYDLNPINTLHNLLLKETFTWSERIKVAFEFAKLLKLLHTPDPPYLPYLVRSIADTHIMVDQESKPKLVDFSDFCGGILPPPGRSSSGGYGYMDPHSWSKDTWSEYSDVYSFGMLLVSLITKRVCSAEHDPEDNCIYWWLENEYDERMERMLVSGFEGFKFSLVHESLEQDPSFCFSDGLALTKLAMHCIMDDPDKRPTMKLVTKALLKLRIVRCYI